MKTTTHRFTNADDADNFADAVSEYTTAVVISPISRGGVHTVTVASTGEAMPESVGLLAGLTYHGEVQP